MTRRHPSWLPSLVSLLTLAAVAVPFARAQEPAKDGSPGYLGIIADDQQSAGRGVRILKVLPGSPAETGGLQVADLLTAINGTQVRAMPDVARAMTGSQAGDKLQFEVVRDNKPESVTVELGHRPPPGERRFPKFGQIPDGPATGSQATGERPRLWLGVRAVDVTPEVRRRLNRPGLSGAVVTEVVDRSPAAESGLVVGAVIVSLDGKRIGDASDLISTVRGASAEEAHTIEFYHPSGALRQENVMLRFKGAPRLAADAMPLAPPPEDVASQEPDGLILPPPVSKPPAASPTELLEQRVARLEAQLSEIERLLRTLVPDETAAPPSEEPVEPPAP